MTNSCSKKKHVLLKRIWYHRWLYVFLLPAIVGFLIFNYIPMLGNIVAFKEYSYSKGIFGSPWVGLKYFRMFINYYQFSDIVLNTVKISLLKIFVVFPIPILFALLLNEITRTKFKRVVQSLSYLPHFVSWVVVVTMLNMMLSPNGGAINSLLLNLGFIEEPIYFLGESKYFYGLVILTDVYKGMGWSSIIYLSTLAGVNAELYEAAAIDGANRFRMVWHVTLPAIKPTAILLFILQFKGILSAGFDQIYLMQTPGNMQVSETLDIFVFRQGLLQFNISYSTAIGFFISLFSLILMILINYISRKLTDLSLW
ncbi:MAG: ABC transporter permease [Candidatus Merdivicinus sp.]|jgi:putative aldouronate transport system permease protein